MERWSRAGSPQVPRRRAGLEEARESECPPSLSPWAWRAKQRSRLEIITWSEDTAETRTRAPRDSWAREVALVTFPQSLVVWLPPKRAGAKAGLGEEEVVEGKVVYILAAFSSGGGQGAGRRVR